MGSKGSQTTTTGQNQSQTSGYVPTGGGYMTNALNQGAAASQLPFNVPQAPVAGFSNDQQQGFQDIRNAQGMSQPYFNQAQNYFNQSAQAPNISQFFNPYAGAVTNQLQNIFGQQQSQATGQLTQAAGGVGADRIAVGQSQLANQQGLAAGQTMAGLYGPSLQAAMQEQNIQQGAGYGMGALGPAAQNSAMSGAQQLLGVGGLQQQLQQAQLNAPYQQQVAQAAFPYQQAQFNAGITSALAPGLGGITAGTGTGTGSQSQPGPSWLSQILGGGLTAAGIAGGLGWAPLAGLALADGGVVPSGYDSGGRVGYDGGGVADSPYVRLAEMNELAQDDRPPTSMMPSLPSGAVSGQPLTNTAPSVIPQWAGRAAAQAPHPGLSSFNLTAPAAQNPDAGIMSLAQQAARFANRDSGSNSAPNTIAVGDYQMPIVGGGGYRRGGRTHFDIGGNTDETADLRTPNDVVRSRFPTADEMKPPPSMDNPQTAGALQQWGAANMMSPYEAATADAPRSMAQNDPNYDSEEDAALPDASEPRSGVLTGTPSQPGEGGGEDTKSGRKRRNNFMQSPWLALTAAGLGMMASRSPWAGVAIGEGGLQGMKFLQSQRDSEQKDETIDQAAKRLDQEAEWHQFNMTKPYASGQIMDKDTGYPLQTYSQYDPATKKWVPANHGPQAAAPQSQQQPAPKTLDAGIIPANAQLVSGGAYNYSQDAPYVEKGMDVPDPQSTGGRSANAVKSEAEYYLQTGKLPPMRGTRGKVAQDAANYRTAVQNYGNTLAASRGMTPEQVADGWRTAPGMMRFILGPDGRSTVALGTAVRHLDTLKQLSAAWQAGDVQTLNRLKAGISREFGKDAATNLEAAGRIIGPEIIKAIGVAGAGTSEDRAAAASGFSSTASPAQLTGAVDVTQKLLGGQLEGRERQALNAGVTSDRFKSLIGDRPYEILKGSRAGEQQGAGAAPKVGDVKTNAHGVKGRWNGTGWEVIQ